MNGLPVGCYSATTLKEGRGRDILAI